MVQHIPGIIVRMRRNVAVSDGVCMVQRERGMESTDPGLMEAATR